jgi:hypothetical protein
VLLGIKGRGGEVLVLHSTSWDTVQACQTQEQVMAATTSSGTP